MAMTLEHRKQLLIEFANSWTDDKPNWIHVKKQAHINNQWFVEKNIDKMKASIVNNYLTEDALNSITQDYNFKGNNARVGLILAGNIPMVGFHDILCCFLSGHQTKIKCSSQDTILIEYILNELVRLDPAVGDQLKRAEKLKEIDALIATGSNNTAKHLAFYFKNVKSLIRANRNSVAVLSGKESSKDFENLADDVFTYFGLGCRNVSMICCLGEFPKEAFYEGQHAHLEIIHHHKFKNNYDYNYAVMLMNNEKFLTNNVLIAKAADIIQSRIASIHYKEFESENEIKSFLESHDSEIQTSVSNDPFFKRHATFGAAQSPSINDYADGMDTMAFLNGL